MDDTRIIQLTTLWFVVLVYVQTASGGGGGINMAIGLVAILLMYVLPLAIVIHASLLFIGD